jgi:hypothetical protein
MTNDVQKLLFGTREAKIEATKSLIATAGEQVIYNALKVYLLGSWSTSLAQYVAGMLGAWDDDDEIEQANKEYVTIDGPLGEITVSQKTKKLVANTFSDYFFSGIGAGTQYWIQQGMNYVYKSTVNEETHNENGQHRKASKYPSMYFSRYEDPNTNRINLEGLGTFGIAPAKLWEVALDVDMVANGKEWIYKGGREGVWKGKKVEMTDDQKRLWTMAYIIDAIAVAGLSEGFISEANTKMKAISQKKLKSEYGKVNVFEIRSKGTRQAQPGDPADDEEE